MSNLVVQSYPRVPGLLHQRDASLTSQCMKSAKWLSDKLHGDAEIAIQTVSLRCSLKCPHRPRRVVIATRTMIVQPSPPIHSGPSNPSLSGSQQGLYRITVVCTNGRPKFFFTARLED